MEESGYVHNCRKVMPLSMKLSLVEGEGERETRQRGRGEGKSSKLLSLRELDGEAGRVLEDQGG